MGHLSKENHLERHQKLHDCLDELVTDWITHTKCLPSKGTVMELMRWSSSQTNPETIQSNTE